MERDEFYLAVYSALRRIAGDGFERLDTKSIDKIIDELYYDIGKDPNVIGRIDNFARGIINERTKVTS